MANYEKQHLSITCRLVCTSVSAFKDNNDTELNQNGEQVITKLYNYATDIVLSAVFVWKCLLPTVLLNISLLNVIVNYFQS